MRRTLLVGIWPVLCAVLMVADPLAAVELTTAIDLDYTYTQNNEGGDVEATTTYGQKYELKYDTSLTSAFDFIGAVRLELQDEWNTNDADSSSVKPTLELQAKGSQAGAKIAYEGTIDSTDVYRETGESTTYSTSLSADLQVTAPVWPELKIKLQRNRSYDPWTSDESDTSAELSTRKDIYALRLDFSLKLDDQEQVVPERTDSDEIQWAGKATYKQVLWGGTEFELAYEIKEDYTKERTRGVFSSETEEYAHLLKTRVKNSLALTPKLTLGLIWEYQFDQDLLALDYDYKLKNKYQAELRWDLMPWLKITGDAKRESQSTAAVLGEDDDSSLSDSFKTGFDLSLISWLRLSGKAEFTKKQTISSGSGASLEPEDDAKFELSAKNSFGTFWDLNVSASSSVSHANGWISDRDAKFKSELKLKAGDLSVTPSFEVSRTNSWEWGFDDPTEQTQSRDAKIKFDYKAKLGDLLSAAFSHEYGIGVEDSLDEVLNFESTLEFSESTSFQLTLADLIRDLKLEGEIERKGSDTEDDPDPELVELMYTLKLEWKLDALKLGASLKYNDSGDSYDDVSFNTKVSWSVKQLEVAGEYQFDKTYAEVTDEDRKLNLKLKYRF